MALKPDFDVIYKEVDDIKISTDIYLPPRKEGKRPVSTSLNVRLSVSHPAHKITVIDIHGGGFMLGYSGMVNKDQIADCLSRGWIVVVPNHRLCPQINLLEGPMQDCRDLLKWIYSGRLQITLVSKLSNAAPQCDLDRVMAFGTSAGGHLALSLCWDVQRAPAAILDFYGPCHFEDPLLNSPLEAMRARIPKFEDSFLNKVYEEKPVPTMSEISLEGGSAGPDFRKPRDAFTFTRIANGTVWEAIWPSKAWKKVDPILNITSDFPPTCIIHGQADTMVSIELSRALYAEMKNKEVEVEMIEVPGENHTFCGNMKVGSQTWNLQRKGFDFLESVIAR